MAGVCIDKLPHSCGTRQGLQVFADPEKDTVNGFCYSCSTFVANPYGDPVGIGDVKVPEPKTQEQIDIELLEVANLQVLDLPTRKLRAKNLEEVGIKVAVSEQDGKTPSATYFPITKDGVVTGYYIKTLSKPSITSAIGDVKQGQPFNWVNARKSGAYRLIIVEGKEDVAAVNAIFDRHGKNPDYHPAVISLPNGTNSVKSSLTPLAQDIKRLFKEVVICFDNDNAGHKALKDAMQILPTALEVILPEKDPNDCILKGAQQAAYKALSFHAAAPKNTRVIRAGAALHQSAREPTPYGQLTWPYDTMNGLLRNIRYGETIYIGAGAKMG